MYQGLVSGLMSAGQRNDQDLRNRLLQQRQQWDEQDRLSKLREEGFLQAVQEVEQLGGLSDEGLKRFNASGRFRATAVTRANDGSQVWQLPDGTRRVMPYARVRELLFRENAAQEKRLEDENSRRNAESARAEDANHRANAALGEEISQNAFRNDIATQQMGLARNEDARAEERMGLAYNADRRADDQVANARALSTLRENSRLAIEKIRADAKREAAGKAKGMAERDRLQWFDRYDAQAVDLEKQVMSAEDALKAIPSKDRQRWDRAANDLLKVQQRLEDVQARRDSFAPGGQPQAAVAPRPGGLMVQAAPEALAVPQQSGAGQVLGGAIGNAFVPGVGGLVGRTVGGMIPTQGALVPQAQRQPAGLAMAAQPDLTPDSSDTVLARLREIEGAARKRMSAKAEQAAAEVPRDAVRDGSETPDLGLTAARESISAMAQTLGRGEMRDVANQAEFAKALFAMVRKAGEDLTANELMQAEQHAGKQSGDAEAVLQARTYLVELAKALGTQAMVGVWNVTHPNDKMSLAEWDDLVASADARKEFARAVGGYARGIGSAARN